MKEWTKEDIQRFWSKVKKTSSCWIWRGLLAISGYGKIEIKGKHLRAHRVSWILANGKIPKGTIVCHHCDVRNCVRPDHLFVGTQADNMKDMIRKGRSPSGHVPYELRARGERHGNAKLSTHKVRRIRSLYAVGNKSLAAIGRMFGVWPGTVLSVVQRRYWAHVK